MGRVVHENRLKVRFLADGIADELDSADESASVLAAEWSAAVDLTPNLTVDGLNISPTNNNASIAMMNSGKIGERPGTSQMGVTLNTARDDSDDVVWDLAEHGVGGDLLVSRFGDPDEGDPIEVYRGEFHNPAPTASAQDTYQQATATFAVDNWKLKASIAAA
jgi:hypothetical protein